MPSLPPRLDCLHTFSAKIEPHRLLRSTFAVLTDYALAGMGPGLCRLRTAPAPAVMALVRRQPPRGERLIIRGTREAKACEQSMLTYREQDLLCGAGTADRILSDSGRSEALLWINGAQLSRDARS